MVSRRTTAAEHESENWNANGCGKDRLAFQGIILADRNESSNNL